MGIPLGAHTNSSVVDAPKVALLSMPKDPARLVPALE
jgi:hypothetical protein